MPASTEPWDIYRGTGRPGTREEWPEPPAWRRYGGGPDLPAPPSEDFDASVLLGDPERPLPPVPEEVDRVNAALRLRRPLLVSGEPGTGKSSLAYRISRELGLGRVLRWQITSLSTLQEGLYGGDGRLGPLGTAFLPHRRPRVLLIDHLDQAEIALPEDLCSVLSAGGFSLRGAPPDREMRVAADDDPATPLTLPGPVVRCHAFPVVVITTSGARDLPYALVRRCVGLRMPRPSPELLRAVAAARFPADGPGAPAADMIDAFLDRAARDEGSLVERFLDALHLAVGGALEAVTAQGRSWQEAVDTVWQWTAAEEP
ncbi:AAA family ATPase [Streptomyces chromofuscus]|uniref:MoxR family ATPase n=1 Tax=Streptomyces chromofuscus TaxID=42881 RepID=A0A7M2TGC2_STRCW|nr:AAA family ATPase [Streptomyces chromofuscus]QOV47199.1 MoxR family ATPase [Streptomyces chromofuscus]GGT37824.1 ATPase AAA [Streptomyces chromofuscus]